MKIFFNLIFIKTKTMGIFQFPVHSNRYIIYLFAFTHIFGLTAKNIILFISETYNLAEWTRNEWNFMWYENYVEKPQHANRLTCLTYLYIFVWLFRPIQKIIKQIKHKFWMNENILFFCWRRREFVRFIYATQDCVQNFYGLEYYFNS